MQAMGQRRENDSLGAVDIPAQAYYGPQTQRAVENFAFNGRRMPLEFLYGLARIKRLAATVNHDLGELTAESASAIAKAAREVEQGRWDDQFPVEVFQTGSGTSSNMNMNEVLATRANEILTGRKQAKHPVHPNDQVNRGQSSNDVIPSALHLAAVVAIREQLVPALKGLDKTLQKRAREFADLPKIGRTHLMDAVPMTLGQEFGGFARQMELAQERLQGPLGRLAELPLGGTAVGTGLNAHPEFAGRVIGELARETGFAFVEARDHFEAQGARDAVVETSGVLKTIALGLAKIANDIRWLASGPRCGLGELRLPALQPGSSIMPGKVNPVIPEAVIQVAAQVVGHDTILTLAGQGGFFQLNTMMPLMVQALMESIRLLAAAARALDKKCITGLSADEKVCRGNIEKSLALVTALVPYLGYDRAAKVAKTAYESGCTIREVVLAEKLLDPGQLEALLPPQDLNR
ncbi:MAG: class II fumarate hydratase [Desulfobacterales bacterium]